jgi:hypothetical protein
VIKFTPIKSASAGGMEMGLTAGAAAGSSSSRKDGTSLDVPAGGASFTTGASRAPRDDDTGDKDADNEESLLDDTILTIVPEGRASDERGTLRMQRLWMNVFFTILVVVRLKR